MEIAQQVQAGESDGINRQLKNVFPENYDATDHSNDGTESKHSDVVTGPPSDIVDLARKLLILHKETNEYSDERLPHLLLKQQEYLVGS